MRAASSADLLPGFPGSAGVGWPSVGPRSAGRSPNPDGAAAVRGCLPGWPKGMRAETGRTARYLSVQARCRLPAVAAAADIGDVGLLAGLQTAPIPFLTPDTLLS